MPYYYPNKFKGIPFDREHKALELCLDEFTAWMRDKLMQKLKQGYGGWDSESREYFVEEIRKQIELDKFDPVDVAIFAMFYWNVEGGPND